MLIVWRITTARFARSAFSGEGARLYGGWWRLIREGGEFTEQGQYFLLLDLVQLNLLGGLCFWAVCRRGPNAN